MVAILVALIFVGFVLFDLVLQKVEARRAALAAAALPWAVPEGISLSPNHAWLAAEERGAVRVGADALVGHALGAVRRVVFPQVGRRVRAGEPLFHLDVNGESLAVCSPVKGTVLAVNRTLEETPDLVARDPYQTGWVCSLMAEGQVNSLIRLGSRATPWLEAEFLRFKDLLSLQASPEPALGLTSQDGGMLVPGSLTMFDRNVWVAFEEEFLRLS